ncbi:MAG: type II secretion system F family protein [Phycisphaerales bacterium]|nr:type II secretion system F family protein [Phycisphaerales bacterium]
MPTFAYIARDASGRRVRGNADGNTEQSVLTDLSTRGLTPIRVTPARTARNRKRVSTRILARSYVQLSELLRAGVPLLRSLRLLARGKSHPQLAAIWAEVAESVSRGERFSDSMAAHPHAFGEVHIAMVRAGERGAFLESVLARLGAFLDNQAELRAKIIGNLLYPVVLLTVALGVIVGALIFFVPKFKDLFGDMELPLSTRLLLGTSALVVAWWPLMVAFVVALAIAVQVARKKESLRLNIARRFLRLPKVGGLFASLAVARFARILGTLLENGIPMISALEIARDAAGNALMARAITEAAESVRQGEQLSTPLAQSGLFEEDVIEMITVGESANSLPSVLVSLADTMERRVDRACTALLKLMEPALLLGLAGLVFFIFLALVLPMMQMSSQL